METVRDMIRSGRMHLVLFDVDGTLLACGDQVGRLFVSALEAVYGQAGAREEYDFSGKTDPQIVRDLQRGAGLTDTLIADGLSAFKELYLRRLEKRLDRDRMCLLPEVVETLERLSGRSDVLLGLLTGNWEAGARIKLSRFGLNRFFSFGAFGDAASDRDALPPVAVEQAWKATGRRYGRHETVIVGDSALDVACARRHGIPVLAVATGRTPAGELEAAGADWVISSLGEASSCHPAFAC